MSNNYRNCEGYPDPTAGEALSRIAANEKQSLRAFKNKGQFHTKDPQPGDQIFFGTSLDNSTHTGIVESVDKKQVHTIEGNTSDERLRELQKELVKKANQKDDYDAIADEILRFRDMRKQAEVDSVVKDEQMRLIQDLRNHHQYCRIKNDSSPPTHLLVVRSLGLFMKQG